MRIVGIAAFIALAVAGSAMADMLVTLSTTGGGSPYIATVASGSDQIAGWNVGESFATFCLEKKEYFYPGHTYKVNSLDPWAVNGGVGSVNGKDPIDIATAWLYDSYLEGTLGNYTATQVQNVIWYIEQEVSSLSQIEQSLLALANDGGASWDGDFHGVQVMNLIGVAPGDFNPAQSQLIREKQQPGPPVPAPGAAVLGLIGLAMVNWMKRRFA